ncbi:MAG TPA: BLUF domain-containing protein [Hymenobacter sp.]
MTVHQIVYTSSATDAMGDEQLKSLLLQARATNHDLRITGILLFSDGLILQVLEGEEDVVRSLYDKIRHDPRHTHVMTLSDGAVERRVFPDWSMGFPTQKTSEFLQLAGFVDSTRRNFLLPRAHNASPELQALLHEFVADQEAKVRV